MRNVLFGVLVLAVGGAGAAYWFFKQQTGVSSPEQAVDLLTQFNAAADEAAKTAGLVMQSTIAAPAAQQPDGGFVGMTAHRIDLEGDGFADNDPLLLLHALSETATSTRMVTTLAEQPLRAGLLPAFSGAEPMTVTSVIKPTGASFEAVVNPADWQDGTTAVRAARMQFNGTYALDGTFAFNGEGGKALINGVMTPDPAVDNPQTPEDESLEPVTPVQVTAGWTGWTLQGESDAPLSPLAVGDSALVLKGLAVLAQPDGGDEFGVSAETLQMNSQNERGQHGVSGTAAFTASGIDATGAATEFIGNVTSARMDVRGGPVSEGFVERLQAMNADVQGLAAETPEAAQQLQAITLTAFSEALAALSAPLEIGYDVLVEGDNSSTFKLDAALEPVGEVDPQMLMPTVIGNLSADLSFHGDVAPLFEDQPDALAMLIGAGFLLPADNGHKLDANYAGGMLSVNGGPGMPVFQLVGMLMQGMQSGGAAQ